MKVIQISDCHLFSNPESIMAGVNTCKSLQKVLTIIAEKEKPEMLIITGDIAHDEELNTYQTLKHILDELQIPYYCLPGNHDNPQYMHTVFRQNFSGDFLNFKQLGWNFILLSTAIAGKVHGDLSNEQLAKLSSLIQENINPAIIFMHHHPVPIHSPWMDVIAMKRQEALLTILKSNDQVKAVCFGHIHQEHNSIYNNISFLGVPSTCFQFKPNTLTIEYDNLQPAYRSFYLNTDGTFETQVTRINIS